MATVDSVSSSSDLCALCGTAVDNELEDTNGWRWFNDGHGGLLSLCPDCPVPSRLQSSRTEDYPAEVVETEMTVYPHLRRQAIAPH